MFGSVSAFTVLHASLVPPIGSNPDAMLGFPPAEVNSCAASDPSRTLRGCSFPQVAAVNGPPPGAAFGHVCVYAVTLPFFGAIPVRFRRASKNLAPCSWKARSVFSLLEPRLCPRSPNCRTALPLFARDAL